MLIKGLIDADLQELMNNFTEPLQKNNMIQSSGNFIDSLLGGYHKIFSTTLGDITSGDVPSVSHGSLDESIKNFNSTGRFFFSVEKYVRLVEKNEATLTSRSSDLYGIVSPDRLSEFFSTLSVEDRERYISDFFGDAVLQENEEVGPYGVEGDIGLHYGIRVNIVDKDGAVLYNQNSEAASSLKAFTYSDTNKISIPLFGFENRS